MDLLRKYIWLFVIFGILFSSLVIILIFLLINKCISRAAKHRLTPLQRRSDFSVQSNKYQETYLKTDNPPLPPRTQFLTADAQSYENLAEVSDCEQGIPDYEQSTADYEQSTPDYVQPQPEYKQSTADYVQAEPDYEQSTADYVQPQANNEEDMPNYVKVDAETTFPLPPPYQDPDPAADNTSSEDYDDIGGEDDEEDYDDVA
ncbi:uncharacterized protein scimp [Larimichthys crocea]|uniref:uncharacterized protein scimp n=1 Tax=Larimichthys crocea TaxID=215358 RepID=UPI000F5E4860|nr:uncharacterized protein LOC104919188 [Larimichthys crocea]